MRCFIIILFVFSFHLTTAQVSNDLMKKVKTISKDETKRMFSNGELALDSLLLLKLKQRGISFIPYYTKENVFLLYDKYSEEGVVYESRQALLDVFKLADSIDERTIEAEIYPFVPTEVINHEHVKQNLAKYLNVDAKILNWTYESLGRIDKIVKDFYENDKLPFDFYKSFYPKIALYATEIFRRKVKGVWVIEEHKNYKNIWLPKIRSMDNKMYFLIPRIYEELTENIQKCSILSLIESEFLTGL
jgi:hypothetical protein